VRNVFAANVTSSLKGMAVFEEGFSGFYPQNPPHNHFFLPGPQDGPLVFSAACVRSTISLLVRVVFFSLGVDPFFRLRGSFFLSRIDFSAFEEGSL